MAWAKLDDRYDDNPKIKRAWKRHPAAVGLHTMAVTYCCRHELDGVVDMEWIEEKLPVKRERDLVCDSLVEIGLFEERPGGFMVRNFLEFNPSKQALADRRKKDRDRKESNGNKRGSKSYSKRNPAGNPSEAVGTHAHPGAQDGTGRGEVPTTSQGTATSLTRELVDEAVSILQQRWEDVSEVAVENCAGSCPDADLLQGCRLAVTWASDPSWEMKSCAATLRSAMRKLETEKPKADAKADRKATNAADISGLLPRTVAA